MEGICQQDDGDAEGQVEAPLRDIVQLAQVAGIDMEDAHEKGDQGGGFDEDGALALFQGLGGGKLAVKTGDVNLLYGVLFCHRRFLLLSEF